MIIPRQGQKCPLPQRGEEISAERRREGKRYQQRDPEREIEISRETQRGEEISAERPREGKRNQ